MTVWKIWGTPNHKRPSSPLHIEAETLDEAYRLAKEIDSGHYICLSGQPMNQEELSEYMRGKE